MPRLYSPPPPLAEVREFEIVQFCNVIEAPDATFTAPYTDDALPPLIVMFDRVAAVAAALKVNTPQVEAVVELVPSSKTPTFGTVTV